MPGAHKIGAAISGPRIMGGNFMDITLFLIFGGPIRMPELFICLQGHPNGPAKRTFTKLPKWGQNSRRKRFRSKMAEFG